MLENFLKNLVDQYLGDFFDYESLSFKGLGRHVEVIGLTLNPDLLPKNLPVRVHRLKISSIELQLSPFKLFSSSSYGIKLIVNKVDLELKELSEEEWDENVELEALMAAKLECVKTLREAAITRLQAQLNGLDTDLSQVHEDSHMTKLIKSIGVRIADNVEVRVNSINISFLYDNGGNKGRASLKIKRLLIDNSSLDPTMYTSPSEYDSSDIPTVSGIIVTPVEGATNKIVRKEVQVHDIEIDWVTGDPRTDAAIVDPFTLEVIFSFNTDDKNIATMCVCEVALSSMQVKLEPAQMTDITFVSDRLSRQATWKEWVQEQYKKRIERGISKVERLQCIEAYRRMLGTCSIEDASKDESLQRCTSKHRGDYTCLNGCDDFVAELSWLEKLELRSPAKLVESLLQSAEEAISQLERRRLREASKARPSADENQSMWNRLFSGGSKSDPGTEGDQETSNSAHEFASALGVEFDEKDLDPKEKKRRLLTIFNAIDVDKSGSIDAYELQVGLRESGTSLSSKSILELMRKYDLDNSGTIDFDEFCKMCEQASNFVSRGRVLRPPVIAVSARIQSFSFSTWKYSDDTQRLKEVGLCLLIQQVCINAAVEGLKNVGRKGFKMALESVGVNLNKRGENGQMKTVPILSSRKNEKALDKGTPNMAEPVGEHNDSINKVITKPTRKLVIEVLRLKLYDSSSIKPYCCIQAGKNDHLKQSPVDLVCTPKSIASEKSGNKSTDFIFDNSGNDEKLTLEYLFDASRTNIEIVVQAKQGKRAEKNGKGWIPSMFQSEPPVVVDEHDPILAEIRTSISMPCVEDLAFSRLSRVSSSYEESICFENGIGEVSVRITQDKVSSFTESISRNKNIFQLETAATVRAGCLDAAIGLSVNKLTCNMDKDISACIASITAAYANAPAHSIRTENQPEELHWRKLKSIIEIKLHAIEGGITALKIECGGEKLGCENLELKLTADKKLSFTLGQIQNLHQLTYGNKHSSVDITALSGESKIGTLRFNLVDLLSLPTQGCVDAQWYVVPTFNEEDSKFDGQSNPMTLEELGADHCHPGESIQLKLEIRLENHAEEKGLKNHASSSVMEDSEHDWTASEQGDLLGLTSFPPVFSRNIAEIHIQVLQAKNLPDGDFSTDPYCLLKCKGEEYRTHIKYDTNNPIWLENDEDKKSAQFSFGPLTVKTLLDERSTDELVLMVKDKDSGGDWDDDLLGVAHLELSDMYSKLFGKDWENIDAGRSTTMWVPLHWSGNESTGSNGDLSGAVEIRFWFVPLHEKRHVESTLPLAPLHLNVSFFLMSSLPRIFLPADNPAVGIERDVILDLGSSNASIQFNDGATHDTIRSLEVINALETFARSEFGPAPGELKEQLTEKTHLDMKRKSLGRPISSDNLSFVTGNEFDEEGSEFYSAIGDADTADLDEFYEVEANKQHVSDRWSGERVSVDIFVDGLSLGLSVFSNTLGEFRSLGAVKFSEIDFGLNILVSPEGRLNLNLLLGLKELSILDGLQTHEICFRSFDFLHDETIMQNEDETNKYNDKQIQLKVKYGNDDDNEIDHSHVVPQKMSIDFQVTEMVLLCTAILSFQSKLDALLGTDNDNVDTTDGIKDEDGVIEGDTTDADADSSGLILPVSDICISANLKNIEMHFMDRKVLGVMLTRKGYKPLRFPPKSAVLLVSNSIEYYAYPNTDNEQYFGLPSKEVVNLKTDVSMVIKRSRLKPHMYTDLPDDFNSGDNEIIKPFSILITTNAYPLQLYKSNGRDYRKFIKGMHLSGNHQPVRDFRLFAESLSGAKESRIEEKENGASGHVTRTIEANISTVEFRLDTGDYKYLIAVAENHSDFSEEEEPVDDNDKDSVQMDIIQHTEKITDYIATSDIVERKEEDVIYISNLKTSDSGVMGKIEETETQKTKGDNFVTEEDDNVPLPSWIFMYFLSSLLLLPKGYNMINRKVLEQVELEGNNNYVVERSMKSLSILAKEVVTAAEKVKTHAFVHLCFKYFMFGVGNNLEGFSSPFIRFVVNKIEAKSLLLTLNDISFDFEVRVQASLYNHIAKHWEAFIEPWVVRGDGLVSSYSDLSVSKPHTVFHAYAPWRLNINFTDALVENLSKLSYYTDANYIPQDDERLHGTYCPNWLVNETGDDIVSFPIREPNQILHGHLHAESFRTSQSQDAVRIRDQTAEKLHLGDTISLYIAGKSLLKLAKKVSRKRTRQARQLLARNKRAGYDFALDQISNISRSDEEELTDLFKYIDTDGSGEITVSELHSCFMNAGYDVGLDVVIYKMGIIDELGVENVDKDTTTLSLKEFLDFFLVKETDMAISTVCKNSNQSKENNLKNSSLKECYCIALTIDAERKNQLHEVFVAPSRNMGDYAMVVMENSDDSTESDGGVYDSDSASDSSISGSSCKEQKSKRYHDKISQLLTSRFLIGKVKKMGRTDASNVLFVQTPIRIENRLSFPLEVWMIKKNKIENSYYPELKAPIFTLQPGDERSIPLRYIYTDSYGESGSRWQLKVRPLPKDLLSLKENSRKRTLSSRSSSSTSSTKSTRSRRKLGSIASVDSVFSTLYSWETSPVLGEIGGADMFTLSPDIRPNPLLKSDMDVGYRSSRVVAKYDFDNADERSKGSFDFECSMLVQKDRFRKYEFKEGVLTIQVMHARDLVAADSDGKSDPYVSVKVGNEKHRTPVAKNTLDPWWPSASTFRFGERRKLEPNSKVTLKVVDHDKASRNDPLGYKHFTVSEILDIINNSKSENEVHGIFSLGTKRVEQTFKLEPGKGISKRKVKGTLTVAFSFEAISPATQTPKLYTQQVLSFYPSFVIENLLPYSVEFEFTNPESLEVKKIKASAGAQMSLPDVDGVLFDFLRDDVIQTRQRKQSRADRKKSSSGLEVKLGPRYIVKVRVRYRSGAGFDSGESAKKQWSDWSEAVETSNDPIRLSYQNGVTDSPKDIIVSLKVASDVRNNGGARRLVIWAPYWFVNRTNMILNYQPVLDSQNKKPLVSVIRHNPFLSSEENEDTFGEEADEREIKLVALDANQQVNISVNSVIGNTLDSANGSFCLKQDSEEEFQNFVYLQSEMKSTEKDDSKVIVSPSMPSSKLLICLTRLDIPETKWAEHSLVFAEGCLCKEIPKPFNYKEIIEGSPKQRSGFAQLRRENGTDNVTWNKGTGTVDLPVCGSLDEISSMFLIITFWTNNSNKKDLEDYNLVIDPVVVPLGQYCERIKSNIATFQEYPLRVNFGDKAGSVQSELCLTLSQACVDPELVPIHHATRGKGIAVATQRQFAVVVVPIPLQTASAESYAVTFDEKYIFASLLEFDIIVKQFGAPSCTAVHLRGEKEWRRLSDSIKAKSNTDEKSDDPIDTTGENYYHKSPFHFNYQLHQRNTDGVSDPTQQEKVQIKLVQEGSQWSEPFSINNSDDFALQLRNVRGDKISRVWIDMNTLGPSRYVILRPVSRSSSLQLVKNRTKENIWIAQVIVEKDTVAKSIASAVSSVVKKRTKKIKQMGSVDLVLPDEELPIALDFPDVKNDSSKPIPRFLIMPAKSKDDTNSLNTVPYDDKQGVIIKLKAGYSKQCQLDNGKRLLVSVDTHGSRLIVKATVLEEARPNSIRDSYSTSFYSPKYPSLEFGIHLSSFGLSLFSSQRQYEVAYFVVQRIHYEHAYEKIEDGDKIIDREYVDFSIGHFQVDSSRISSLYPVAITSVPPEKWNDSELINSVSESVRNRKSEKYSILFSDYVRNRRTNTSFLRVQSTYSHPHNDAFAVYNYINVHMRPIDVRIDGTFLVGVLSIIKPLYAPPKEDGSIQYEGAVLESHGGTTDSNKTWVSDFVDTLFTEIEIPEQDSVYVENCFIDKFYVKITLFLASGELTRTLKDFDIHVGAFTLSLAYRMARLEGFKLDIPAASYNNVFFNTMTEKYQENINGSVISQLHELVFNFVNRAGKLLGVTKKAKDLKKSRLPAVPISGIIPIHGPGVLPQHLEMTEEQKAILKIENWYSRLLLRRHKQSSKSFNGSKSNLKKESSMSKKGNVDGENNFRNESSSTAKAKCMGCKTCTIT